MTLPTVTCKLEMVGQDELYEQIKANAPHAKDLIQRDSHKGKTVIICGAGPSLAKHHDWLWETKAHQVWACNSALPYLKDHQLPVSHGFTVDQSIDMIGPAEWERTFDVTYLLGTSVHPKVRQHLQDAARRIVWFHNYLGIKEPEGWTWPESVAKGPNDSYEMYLYTTLFPATVQVGYGLNSVPRAMCLALWMGFEKVLVVGADCAATPDSPAMPLMDAPEYTTWVNSVPLYATGRTIGGAYGNQAIVTEGVINGRRWVTRTDMLITAHHMVQMARSFPGRVHLIGDTLPNAMMNQPKEFFESLPKLEAGGNVSGFAMHRDLEAQFLAQLDKPEEAAV